MNKPFSLIVQETEQEIVEVINKSQLSAYVLKTIVERIHYQLEMIEQNEINKYEEDKKGKQKKESDK